MRIKADFDLCESNAICVGGMAPDFFDPDDDDYLVILQEEIPRGPRRGTAAGGGQLPEVRTLGRRGLTELELPLGSI